MQRQQAELQRQMELLQQRQSQLQQQGTPQPTVPGPGSSSASSLPTQGSRVVLPGPDVAQAKAKSTYSSTQKTISSMVRMVKESVTQTTPADWSEQLSNGLLEQLNTASQKLENELERKYQSLCLFETSNYAAVVKDHEEFIAAWVEEIMAVRIKLLGRKSPSTTLDSSVVSSVAPA